jgi:hypothetical protein
VDTPKHRGRSSVAGSRKQRPLVMHGKKYPTKTRAREARRCVAEKFFHPTASVLSRSRPMDRSGHQLGRKKKVGGRRPRHGPSGGASNRHRFRTNPAGRLLPGVRRVERMRIVYLLFPSRPVPTGPHGRRRCNRMIPSRPLRSAASQTIMWPQPGTRGTPPSPSFWLPTRCQHPSQWPTDSAAVRSVRTPAAR